MMKHLAIVIAILLLTASLSAQANLYSQWSNFPQSPNFFPIGVFLENPNMTLGGSGPYAGQTVAVAMNGMKANIAFAIDGESGGSGWPRAYGSDCGAATCNQFAHLVAQGIYVMPVVDYTGNTSATSVASVQAIAAAQGASQHLIGYLLGDEPACPMTGVTSALSYVQSLDATRPNNWNLTDWFFNHGICTPSSINVNALKAMSIGSYDNYSMVIRYNGGFGVPVNAGQPSDYMWMTAWSVAAFRAAGNANQPIWFYGDDGTDDLAGNSGCTNNLCSSDNHELRATPEQVNAETWSGIINGAMGVLWFCHDTNWGPAGCMADTTTVNNLTYINTTILKYAPQLNSPVLGVCTMATGNQYTNYNTSCSNGILTMSTGTSTVPGSAIVKQYSNGDLHLFADSDRNGQATMTFTLTGYAGRTATVVYDSNAQYDPSNSSVGTTFTLDASGRFSDTFGANGHNYQPKIYRITTGGPAAPTGLGAAVR